MIRRLLGTKTSILLVVSVALNFYFIQRRLDVHVDLKWRDTRSLYRHVNTGIRSTSDQRTAVNKTTLYVDLSSPVSNTNHHLSSKHIEHNFDHENKTGTQQEMNQTPQEPEDRTFLAVAILSAPGNVDRRNAIRKTWKNGYEGRAHYVKFVVGTNNLSTDLVENITKENAKHHDMVVLEDLIESYKNLTYKVLAALKWFDQNVDYSYLFKCDDDTFALLDKLEDNLIPRDHTRSLYWGYFLPDARPLSEGLWAEQNWKFCDSYFPYAFGGGYILSADVIHRIATSTQPLIVYNNEDVSVGAWTVAFDMERKHDVRFNTESFDFGGDCRNYFLVTHKQGVNDTELKDELYRNSGRLCVEEISNRWEYEYNWNKIPSKAAYN